MSAITVVCVLLQLLAIVTFVVWNWFFGGMGGKTLLESMRSTMQPMILASSTLIVVGLLAQFAHQRKRNRSAWPYAVALLAVLPFGIWSAIDVLSVPDEVTRLNEEAKQRVAETVKLRADTHSAFSQSGVLPHVTILGKPGLGSMTRVQDAYTDSPEIKQLAGLVGHPVSVDPASEEFDSITIAFEVLRQAGPVDLQRAEVCELPLNQHPLTPVRLSEPPTIDEAARMVTVKIDHPGVFALFVR